MPGVKLNFRRVGGMGVSPEYTAWEIPSSGSVALNLLPLGDGAIHSEFIVEAPPPYQSETYAVTMTTQDGDNFRFLRFGFGAQVAARARFLHRSTGEPVEAGVNAALVRRSGVSLDADGVLVPLDATGTLNYVSSAASTGTTVADFVVNLRAPFDYDTVRNVIVPSVLESDPTDFGNIKVGSWMPWNGSVVDRVTGAPIAGGSIEFRRVSGIAVAPSPFRTVSAANGQFAISPIPLRNGEVVGDLVVTFGSTYRDTTIQGVRLTTSKSDSLRWLPPILARKIVP